MSTIPVLGAVRAVLFPGMRCGILLASSHAMAAVRAVLEGPPKGRIAVFTTRVADPRTPQEMYSVGTIAQIVSLSKRRCCGRWVVSLRGAERARSIEYVRWEPFREARVEPLAESVDEPLVVEALASAVRRAVTQLHDRKPRCLHATRAHAAVLAASDASGLPGAVSDLLLHLTLDEQQRLLEAEPLTVQLGEVLAHVRALLAPLGTAQESKGLARDLGWS